MATTPLMPKATAVWLVENTALSFDQIADFCKLHPLEVKAIADGDAAQGIKGLDPVLTGQLTPRGDRQGRGRSQPRRLKLPIPRSACPRPRRRRARATRRCRAARTGRTRSSGWCATIPSSRTRRSCASSAPPSRPSRRSASAPTGTPPNLQPMDPVTLGLCSQIDLDFEVQRAAKEKPVDAEAGATLLPAAVTTAAAAPSPRPSRAEEARRRAQRRCGVRQAQADRRQERVATRRRSRASCSRQTNPPVIPGRAEGASPESTITRRWLWIPGSLAALGPRNDTGREGQRRHVR